MRPPFRSVSFPCLADMVGMLPPSSSKTLQRDCTSLRPSCWPLHFVGKCSLAPLARPWLGRLAFARLPPLSARSARSRHCSACLGYAPPDRLAGVRPPFRCSARSARSFSALLRKNSGIFEKKERSRRTHIFPENEMFGFSPLSLRKT